MARLTPRPIPTELQTLKPLLRSCPTCGETLWAAYHNYRTITTLTAVLGRTLQIRRCLNQTCPHVHHPHRPEQEGRLALPKHEFGSTSSPLWGSSAMATTAVAQKSLRPCANAT